MKRRKEDTKKIGKGKKGRENEIKKGGNGERIRK